MAMKASTIRARDAAHSTMPVTALLHRSVAQRDRNGHAVGDVFLADDDHLGPVGQARHPDAAGRVAQRLQRG